jgi:hypothetical protein
VFVDQDPSRPFRSAGELRTVAVVPIACWAGAVLTGRLLAYTYNYLTALDLVMGY